MFEQGIVTRLLLSIKRVKEPRFRLVVFKAAQGGGTVLIVTLFSWRVRLGEHAFPVLWWLIVSILSYLGIRGA